MQIVSNQGRWQSRLVMQMTIGLLVGFVGFFASAAHAACTLNGDPDFEHLGKGNMIVTWDERPCDPESSVKYRTSSDNGQTWSALQVLTSSSVIGNPDDFDGIKIVGRNGKLAAAFSIITPDPALKVILSDNYGNDWGDPIVAWNITDDIPGFIDFLGCPSLTGKGVRASRVLSLLTTIVESTASGPTATVYIVTSHDGGLTWGAPQDLGEVPLDCDD
jgi:hypothetical protein